MSLLFEDQEGEVAQAKQASKRLGALFDDDLSHDEAGSMTFKYEPKPSPSRASSRKPAGSVTGAEPYATVDQESRMLYATTISSLYRTRPGSSQPEACGAAGVALLEETPRSTALVVYDKTKTPFFKCGVCDELVLVPQASNYVAVVVEGNQGEGKTSWSLLFPTQAESEKFAWNVGAARVMAAIAAQEALDESNGGHVAAEVFQDSAHSDDKTAAVGDTVQVVYSSWADRSLEGRKISKEDPASAETVAKFEVGKKSSSVPAMVARAAEGMRRGSKRIAFRAEQVSCVEGDTKRVYSVASFEVTLAKMKKSKSSSAGRRKNTTGSFSEDVRPLSPPAERPSPGASAAEGTEAAAAPVAAAEEEAGEAVQSPEKTDKEMLIERIAKMSAAQNPYGMAPINMFAKPAAKPDSRKSSQSSLPASPPKASRVEEARATPEAPEEEGGEEVAATATAAAEASVAEEKAHSRSEAVRAEQDRPATRVSGPAMAVQAQAQSPTNTAPPAAAAPIQLVLPPGCDTLVSVSRDIGELTSKMTALVDRMDRMEARQRDRELRERAVSSFRGAVEAVADRCRRMFESEREWGEDVDAAIAEAVEAEAEKFRSSLRDWQD